MNILQAMIFRLLVLVFFLPVSSALMANEHSRWELGGNFNIVGSTGTPTNDMLGFGFVGHYQLSNGWYTGFVLDYSPEFDFERTAAVVGVVQDPAVDAIDAIGTSTAITAFVERRYPSDSGKFQWFWNVGAGFANIDMENATGPTAGGPFSTFDITTNAGTETLITGSVGIQQKINANWSARYILSVDQHFADWTVTDNVSGNTAKVDDYTIKGLRIGMNYAF